jgi:uncharacterized membrane protein
METQKKIAWLLAIMVALNFLNVVCATMAHLHARYGLFQSLTSVKVGVVAILIAVLVTIAAILRLTIPRFIKRQRTRVQ